MNFQTSTKMLAHHLLRTSIRQFSKKPVAAKNSLAGSSKVWFGAAAATGVASLGGLAYTLTRCVSPAQDANVYDMTMWPQYVAQRINGTFKYCVGGLGVTTLGAMLTMRNATMMRMMSSNSMFSFLGCLAAMWGTGFLVQTQPFNGSPLGAKSLLYYLHMGVVGAVIAPIAAVGGEACIFAAGLTAAIMAGF